MNFNNTVGILTLIWNFRVSVIVIECINNSIISRGKSAPIDDRHPKDESCPNDI